MTNSRPPSTWSDAPNALFIGDMPANRELKLSRHSINFFYKDKAHCTANQGHPPVDPTYKWSFPKFLWHIFRPVTANTMCHEKPWALELCWPLCNTSHFVPSFFLILGVTGGYPNQFPTFLSFMDKIALDRTITSNQEWRIVITEISCFWATMTHKPNLKWPRKDGEMGPSTFPPSLPPSSPLMFSITTGANCLLHWFLEAGQDIPGALVFFRQHLMMHDTVLQQNQSLSH